jgi:subtilisin family serine protease
MMSNDLFFNSLFFNSLFFNSLFFNSLFFNSLFFNSNVDISLFFNSLFFNSRMKHSLFFNSLFFNSRHNAKGLNHLLDVYKERATKALGLPSWFIWNSELTWGVDRVFDGSYHGNDALAKPINIAILDTGIDTSNPELAGHVAWVTDATGQNNPADEAGHGTAVAGIISAEYNGIGIAGVSTHATLYSVKVLSGPNSEGEWNWLSNGIYAAVAGPDGIVGTADDANIISMSLESQGEMPPAYVHDAITWAYAHGVVLVAAAGNSGDGNLKTSEVTWPAAYPEVIAVGASNIHDQPTSWSDSASYVKLYAPGDNIITTYIDNQYIIGSGTSLAVPFVSGILSYYLANGGSPHNAYHYLLSHGDNIGHHLRLVQYSG